MRLNLATLPNWDFDIDEASVGFYKLRAVHTLGSSIEMKSSDYENLLSEAKAAAQKMESEIAEKVSQRKQRDNQNKSGSGN